MATPSVPSSTSRHQIRHPSSSSSSSVSTVQQPQPQPQPPRFHRRTSSHAKLSIAVGVTATSGARRVGLPRTLSSPRVATLGKKRAAAEVVGGIPLTPRDDHDGEMAVSFLQFCPTCEKQIIVPNAGILYCSESCRRKDTGESPLAEPTSPLPLNGSISPPALPIFSMEASGSPTSLTRVVPVQEPSTLDSLDMDRPSPRTTPRQLVAAAATAPRQHGFVADADPSEWKPSQPRFRRPRAPDPSGSQARHFLAQFHRSTSTLDIGRRRPASADRLPSSSSSTSGRSGSRISRTAPGLYHSSMSAGTSPAESVLDTPRGEGFDFTPHRTRLGGGSESSLRSLAPVVETVGAALEPPGEVLGGLEMGAYPKRAVVHNAADGQTRAAGSLRRLLAEP